MIYLVDEIEAVVIAMRTDPKVVALFDDAKINGLFPFYKYGHRLEIANSLVEKDKDSVYKYTKYPLIALRMDFPENPGLVWDFTLNIAIVMFTEKKYTAEQRYANVFKPILYPLYKSFLDKLKAGGFTWVNDGKNSLRYPPHTKVDRPFYGTVAPEANEAYIFNDPLDAIELIDLKISKRDKNC